MKLALDANRYADLMRGVAEAVAAGRAASIVGIPFVALGEIRAGFRYGRQAQQNERRLGEFLAQDRVQVLWPDEATTHLYAELFADMRRLGEPIPTNGLWIAALCVQHGFVLLTRDRHFEHVPRLARL